MRSNHTIRLMSADDIPSVFSIQAECYGPEAIESEAVFRARLAQAPGSAWVAVTSQGVCAYLVAYPSLLGKVTPLGSEFAIPASPDSLYLHDLAVSRRAAGLGVGKKLVQVALDAGRRIGLAYSSLVSIQNSAVFWRAFGYTDWNDLDHRQKGHLATYPPAACYLFRALDANMEASTSRSGQAR